MNEARVLINDYDKVPCATARLVCYHPLDVCMEMSDVFRLGQAAGVRLPELCFDTDSTACRTRPYFRQGAVGDVASNATHVEDMAEPEVPYSCLPVHASIVVSAVFVF